jgi:hypothetical protein
MARPRVKTETKPMSTSATLRGRAAPQISGDEALRIAHADGLRAYRDLSGYRIILALEPDGWHVDYELKSRTAAGGGPHYIIDAVAGTILANRYEQ